jgi:hypothetical protein
LAPRQAEKSVCNGQRLDADNRDIEPAPWGITQTDVDDLSSLIGEATTALTQAQSSNRTPVITAECKTAFDALIAKMRFIKSRYFLTPPLTGADFISLELKPKDEPPSHRPSGSGHFPPRHSSAGTPLAPHFRLSPRPAP